MSSSKSEGQQQVQDPLVTVEAEINKLEDKRKKLRGKTDEFSQKCYLKLQDELIELRKEKNLIRASATSTAQQLGK